MKIIRLTCRLIISLTFIFSGFVKIVSPVGTGLIVEEYLRIFHLSALAPLAIYIGIILSVTEFVIGTSTLIGYKLKLSVKIGLGLVLFFTLVTLYTAITGKMTDCGCFGEAVHLSSWATFRKNIYLLICYLGLLIQRKRFVPAAASYMEWGYLVLYVCVALAIANYSIFNVPFVEFTTYKIGADIAENNSQQLEYETVFIYEKDGEQAQFSLDELPDSTWTFVDAVTSGGGNTRDLTDFHLYDASGEDFTDEFLSEEKTILLTIYNGARINDKEWKQIEDFGHRATEAGFRFALVTMAGDHKVPDILPENRFFADKKMLMTINRSNGGATYMNTGVITAKWARRNLANADLHEMAEADNDVLIVNNTIRQRLLLVISITALIAVMAIMRYFSNAFYIRRKRTKKHLDVQNMT